MLPHLKQATAALHTLAESAMPSLDELAQLDVYTRCLSDMHKFYGAWEPTIWRTAGVSEAVPDGDARRKLPLLDSDLRALGQPADDDESSEVASSAAVANTGEALGALYVLEGATLGGRVILRHIAEPLGLSLDAGLAFFHGYGACTGQMWTAFGRSLQRWADDGGDQEAAVVGATNCFTAFEAWIRSRKSAPVIANLA